MSKKIVTVQSDAGHVTLYDPTLVRDRVKASSDWWKGNPLATPERQEGRIAVWPLGAGRAATRQYRVRVGDGLTETEQAFVCGASEPTRVRLEGDEVFAGPIERLPGDGAGDRLPGLPDGGSLYAAPDPGSYTVTVHVLNWKKEERFWTEDNEPTADAPPDFVFVLAPTGDETGCPQSPTPLLEFLPKKTATASKKVVKATRPPPRSLEPEKKKRSRAKTKKKTAPTPLKRKQEKVLVRALKPGELGVGAKVRHAVYGVGEIRFMRDGFPKVKVNFTSHGDHKVDKSELTVL